MLRHSKEPGDKMEEMEQADLTHRMQRQSLRGPEPIVYEDGDSLTLQFRLGEIQSEMLVSDPNFLVLSYTRTMMSFLLFHREPRRIAIIGLGGGSIPKWCFHELPATDITVIEIDPRVISLRDQFRIPADDGRFRVLCEDGADYVARTQDAPEALLPEVLLVDGFDSHGQSPQHCSQTFYDDCYRALAPDGLLVVNLCGPGDQQIIERIRRSFHDRVLIVVPREDGENRVVFALKGDRLWIRDDPKDELAKRLETVYRDPSPVSQSRPFASNSSGARTPCL
jgi:spermidine synthase